eukprot:GGOE01032124.1.p1 GENE.GGOE01032124.1~~GGOE01032124.1.p1  ORF type:complete len:745 (+),score=196.24 GGOE01032124.1:30-2237(+)
MSPDVGIRDVVRLTQRKGWADRIVDRLKAAEDDFNGQQTKLIVFLALFSLVVCAGTWGFIYIYLRAYPVCCFPFILVALSAVALCHMLRQRTVMVARHLLCFGLCVSALGVHLTYIGYSGEMANWALLAPQLCIITGGRLSHGLAMLMGVLATMVALALVQSFTDATTYLIQPALNTDWLIFFTTVNTMIPWGISFLLSYLLLGRQRQHDELQRSMAAAEEAAQMIIDFELDSIADLPLADHASILGLLQRVAFNLRLYRPYIPAHLLPNAKTAQEEEQITAFDSTAESPFDGVGQEPGASDISVSHSDGRLSMPSRPRSGGLRAPVRSFEVQHDVRSGTLLYVSLHLMDAYASHSRHNDKVERIRRSADLFCELVMAAVKETHGVVHSMQQNSCFVSWNFGSPCRLHAVNACRAALTIRDRLCAIGSKGGMAPMALSSGVWSGLLVSGTFGTQDYKSSGVLGFGVSRVVELQQYSAAHQRPIVANARARTLAQAQPQQHFLPVDVLYVDPVAHPRDGSGCVGDPADAELIYELLWERTVGDGEWMYQLQRLEADRHLEIEKDVEKLLYQAQAGVEDLCSFQTQVSRLLLSEDPAVSRMGTQLDNLMLTQALDRPYRLEQIRGWRLYAPPLAPSSPLQVPLKKIASASSVASSCSGQSANSNSEKSAESAFALRSSGFSRQRSRLEHIGSCGRVATPHTSAVPSHAYRQSFCPRPWSALCSPLQPTSHNPPPPQC